MSEKPAVSLALTSQSSKMVKSDLPVDLKEVVGEIRCAWIDTKSKIKAIAVIGEKAKEIAIKEKLELYRKYKKLSDPQKAFVDLTGYEVYSKADVERLKRLKGKDFKVYQVFTATLSEKDHAKIQALLKEIEKENPTNYSAVVVSLKKLAESQNLPKEIRDLISKKLEEIPADKRKNIQYTQQRFECSKPSSVIPWKKIAIGALAILVIAGAAYGAYYYHSSKLAENDKQYQEKLSEAQRQHEIAMQQQKLKDLEAARLANEKHLKELSDLRQEYVKASKNNDIKHSEELASRIKSLESQCSSETTQLREAIRKHEYSQTQDGVAISKLTTQKTQLETRVEDLSKQFETAIQRAQAAESNLAKANTDLEQLKTSDNATRNQLAEAQAQVRQAKTALEQANKDLEGVRSDLTQTKSSLTAKTKEFEQTKDELTIAKTQHIQELVDLKKEYETALRNNDIIHSEELASRIKSLESQCSSETTQLREAIRKHEYRHAQDGVAISRLTTEKTQLETKVGSLRTELQTATQRAQKAEKDYQALQTSNTATSQQLEDARKALEQTNKDLEGVRSELTQTQGNLTKTTQELEQTKGELTIAKTQQTQDKEAISRLTIQKTQLETRVGSLTTELQTATLKAQTAESNLSKANTDLKQLKTSNNATGEQLAEAQAQVRQAKTALEQANKDLEGVRSELKQTTSSLTAKTNELKQIQGELTTAKTQQTQDKETISKLTTQKSELETRVEDLSKQLQTATSKAQTAESNLSKANTDLKQLKTSNNATGEQLAEAQAQVRQAKTALEQANKDLEGVRSELKQTTSSLTAKTNELKQIQGELTTAKTQQTQDKETISKLTTQKSELETRVEDLSKQLQTATSKAQTAEKDYQTLQTSRPATNQQLDDAKKALDKANKDLEGVREELIQTKSSLNRINQDMNQWKEEFDQEKIKLPKETAETLGNRLSDIGSKIGNLFVRIYNATAKADEHAKEVQKEILKSVRYQFGNQQ